MQPEGPAPRPAGPEAAASSDRARAGTGGSPRRTATPKSRPRRRDQASIERQVVGDAVLARDPFRLADVGRQHLLLHGEAVGDVGAEVGDDPAALAVAPADRVHEIEVRDRLQRRARPRCGSWARRRRNRRRGPARSPPHGRDGSRRARRRSPGRGRAQRISSVAARRERVVVEHAQVRQVGAAVLRPDQRRRARRLGLADAAPSRQGRWRPSRTRRRSGWRCGSHGPWPPAAASVPAARCSISSGWAWTARMVAMPQG